MTEREERIIKAAFESFIQYGFKRVTMNDIALQAGIARQTLYNAYANKEEVLCACIRYYNQQTVMNLEQGFSQCDSLKQVLEVFCEEVSLKPYHILHQSAHANEIIDGLQDYAAEEMQVVAQSQQHYLTQALLSYVDLPQHGVTELAEYIWHSAKAIKSYAHDEVHLRQQLATLVALVQAYCTKSSATQ